MRKFGKFLKYFSLTVLTLSLIGCLSIYLYFKPSIQRIQETVYGKMASITLDTFKLDADTRVYGSSDDLIMEININNYIYTPISSTSSYLTDGYIAVEDTEFMSHNGLSYKGIARSILSLIKNKGEITQGGSTITQQVLKNNVFQDIDSKFERKVLEIFLAPEFEKMFSKSQIMEFYLNTNYYANGCYGVGSASNYYFGKSPNDLTLSESAILVGISNSPSTYNPVTNPTACIEKRDFVLNRMLLEDKITEDEYNDAIAEPLTLVLNKEYRTTEDYLTSYAIHSATLKVMEIEGFQFKYVFDSLEEQEQYKSEYSTRYSLVSETIRNGGYEIYTSLSVERQNILQQALDNELSVYKSLSEDGRYELQGSATLVNNYTGLVEAIVGGRGTTDEYNRGFLGYRQPGSAIKPLLVYAPAFETGDYYPSSIIEDKDRGNYPNNANNKYLGNITIREAIARSTNTIPYYLLQQIGVRNGVEYLGQLKFRNMTYADTQNYSMALGGFTYGVTTEEMAKAYSTLATGGVYTDNTCIRLIKRDGEVIYEFDSTKEKYQVYDEDVAYLTVDTLKGVIESPYGTATSLKSDTLTIAGKTGTTNNNKDSWFSGITPDYSLTVWVGYDLPRELTNTKHPQNIFKTVIETLYQNKTCGDFIRPTTIIERDGELFSGNIEKAKQERELELQAQKQAELERVTLEQEKALQSVIESDLQAFKSYQVTSIDDLENYMYRYSSLVDSINSLKDKSVATTLLEELNTVYTEVVNSSSFIALKLEYDNLQIQKYQEEQRKQEEIQKQQELNAQLQQELAEKQALLNDNLILDGKLAVQNLQSAIRMFDGTDIENLVEVYKIALEQVNKCQGLTEYKTLLNDLAQLEMQVYEIASYFGYIIS